MKGPLVKVNEDPGYEVQWLVNDATVNAEREYRKKSTFRYL